MNAIIPNLRKLARARRCRAMRRIVQQSGSSCGVACVAMLARIGFNDAFRLGIACCGKGRWSSSHLTLNKELRTMLAAVGYRLGREVPCDDWDKVPPGSLVGIHWNREKETWHWVVYDEDEEGGYILDPNPAVKRKKRRDFEKMNVAWYHRLTDTF